MTEASRGPILTTFAVLFGILALSNLLKPLHLDPNAGFVFLGTKTHGIGNAILGPAFGLLVAYAIDIWRMRRWVIPIADAYAIYVPLNILLYTIRNAAATGKQSVVFMILYAAIAIGVSAGSAALLHRRKHELR
jgi:hypothetical protein